MARPRAVSLVTVALCFFGTRAKGCTTSLDCELLGVCTNNACVCHPGFTGPTCGQLDLAPVSVSEATAHQQPGKVWPRSVAPFDPPKSAHTTIGWSFSPVWDPANNRFVAAAEVVCDKWGSDVWVAAVSAASPNGPWEFERRLGPADTTSPHLRRLPNGTFALIFNAQTSGIYPSNATRPGNPPVCVGNATPFAPELLEPALRPCGVNEAPSLGHNCICSRVSKHCPGVTSSIYVATTTTWPSGPWRIAPVAIAGPGWAPYNATLRSIGTSNPTQVLLADNKTTLVAVRSHAGYWPGVNGEHTGFAFGSSVEGPFEMVANLSWQYGNDEDPFVWQQPDGTLHCLYHNGRSWKHPNHGLHAFSTDGKVWHKPADALLPSCAKDNPADPSSAHQCSALYNNTVHLEDGSVVELEGRERPALLFDSVTGAPTWLFNGAISTNQTVPWFAMAQPIHH